MTKNRKAASADVSGQTVTVLDRNGTPIGRTYPRRAKGLVKKCRAEYASDDTIRLYADCPMYNDTEEHTMEINEKINYGENAETAAKVKPEEQINYIYLEPREWRVNPDTANQTKFERFFMETPFGEDMQEVLSLGAWSGEWCEIISRNLPLVKGTKYNFVFWLNGGENDRFNERCEFHVIFTDRPEDVSYRDWEQRLCYKLNRGYTKPLRKYKGWELYSIPFTVSEEFTQLRFVAQYAPMALLHADSPEAYAGLENIPDEYEGLRPQRHNIVFEDGWPTNTGYATRVLASIAENKGEPDGSGRNHGGGAAFPFSKLIDMDDLAEQIAENIDTDDIAEQIADSINMDEISRRIVRSIDMDEIAEQIAENIDMGEISEQIAENIDMDEIVKRIVRSARE